LFNVNYLWGPGITPIVLTTPPILNETLSQGLTFIPAFLNSTQKLYETFQNPGGTVTAINTILTMQFIAEVTSDNAVLIFNGFHWTGQGTSDFDVWITEVGPNAN